MKKWLMLTAVTAALMILNGCSEENKDLKTTAQETTEEAGEKGKVLSEKLTESVDEAGKNLNKEVDKIIGGTK